MLSQKEYEGGNVHGLNDRRSQASSNDYADSEPQRGGNEYVTPKKRVWYADWVRALAIQLVIFVHCLVNAADASGFDPELDPTTQQKKDGIIKSLVQIGIPMFFYISGIGSTFFNTEGKGFAIFVWDKILRLMIPFVVAIFIFLIPRLYFGQPYEEFCRPDGVMENDYWEFQRKTLPTVLTKLSWLWYLPALFIDCILTYPLLAWSVRRARKIPFNGRDDGNIIFLQLGIFVVWCYPAFYLDTSYNYGVRFLLPSIVTLMIIFMLFYSFQLLIHKEGGDKYAMWMKLIGPCGSLCLNLWKDQAPQQPLHHVLMMINYDALFFSQGMVDQLYWKPMMRTRKKMADSLWAPFAVFAFILVYAMSSPQNYAETGFLFFYPLYTDYTIQCLYTTGTWFWTFLTVWMCAAYADKQYNPTVYKFLAGSSLYAYLSHYFFIIMVAVLVIRPYKISIIPAIFVAYLLTNTVIIVSYVILNFIYELIIPPKKHLQAQAQEPEEDMMGLLKDQEVVVEGDKQR